jgi:chemotaxis protein CheC
MSVTGTRWQHIIADLKSENLLRAAMYHAASGLSAMVGQAIDIDTPRVETIPIKQVGQAAGNPEHESVGIYLLIEGALHGQAILLCALPDALHLADLLLGQPAGTSTEIGEVERSALAEVGNLTVSFFLNEVATLTGLDLRPSPPAVLTDMLGAILDVVVTPVASLQDDLLIVETVLVVETLFKKPGESVLAHFWVLPAPELALP